MASKKALDYIFFRSSGTWGTNHFEGLTILVELKDSSDVI